MNEDNRLTEELPSGRPDMVAPPPPPPMDFHEAVREAANSLLTPEVLDAAVQAGLNRAAIDNPHAAALESMARHLMGMINWAHDLYDMFTEHFGGKLPVPPPPPKPGAGIGQ